jgi:Flp pilus assembly protein TadG
MRLRQARAVRTAAAVVETAAVAVIFLLFLFGILEYCRMVYVNQVVENAAREGTRYAIVNSYDPNIVANTQARVQSYMGGLDKTLQNYTCSVFAADANGNNIGSPQNVKFGNNIGVSVTLTYTPIVPSLLFMNRTLTISSTCCMGSEAN